MSKIRALEIVKELQELNHLLEDDKSYWQTDNGKVKSFISKISTFNDHEFMLRIEKGLLEIGLPFSYVPIFNVELVSPELNAFDLFSKLADLSVEVREYFSDMDER